MKPGGCAGRALYQLGTFSHGAQLVIAVGKCLTAGPVILVRDTKRGLRSSPRWMTKHHSNHL